MAKGKRQKGKTLQHAANFITGNVVRVWCLLYTPLALTAMYQLTISGGAAMIVVAAISILVISVGATIFFTWRVLHAAAKFLIFDDQATLLKYGTLYNTLTEEGTLFFLVTLLVRFLWGLVISMLSSFGIAQVAVLIVVELGYILVIAVKWPFSESSDNKFHLFLGVIRIVITGCGLAYIHELQASPEVRQLFGYIQMALHLAVFIVVFALAIWNTTQVVMFWHSRHADSWKGPTKTYNFEGQTSGDETTEHGWSIANRPNSNGFGLGRGVEPGASDDESMNPLKGHRFSVQSNSSLGSMLPGSTQLNAAIHHRAFATHNDSSDDEAFRFISPAERYRQSRLSDLRRSRFATESDAESAILNRRLNTLLPPSSSAAAILTAQAATAACVTYSQSSSSEVDGLAPGKEQGDLLDNPASGPAEKSTHRESYANIQRMSHQQPLADPRTRRMSDIMRDGPHLYRSRQDNHNNELSVGTVQMISDSDARKPGLWAVMKGAIGNAFSFGRRPILSGNSSSSKSKAFEVIRPLRTNYAEPPSSSFNRGSDASEGGGQGRNGRGQQTGDEQLRELNSLGISRFFQESDRGYEKNRNLFVANPESRISRNGSMASTLSGAVPPFSKLNRNGSNTGVSIKSLVQGNRSGERGSGSGGSTVTTIPSIPTAQAIGLGVGSSSFESHSVLAGDLLSEYTTGLESLSISEQDTSSEGRRISALSAVGGSGLGMRYGRGSVESNIAEALLVVTPPLRLQGGGTLKVSKGPEKSVKYWHKESGQYIESRLSNTTNLSTTTSSPLSSASPSPLLSGIVTSNPVTGRIAASGTNMIRHRDSVLDNSNRSVATTSPSSPASLVSVRDRSSVTPLIVVPTAGLTSSPMTVSSPQSPETPESLADSQQSGQSNNIMASAGRMHEILGRMFSGHQQDIDESDSMSEDTCSTFSGRASGMSTAGTRSTPNQRTDVRTGSDLGQDVLKSSEQQYDILEPVYEGSDDDDALFTFTSVTTTSAVLKDRVPSPISSLTSSTSNITVHPLTNDRQTLPLVNMDMSDAPDFNTEAESSRKRNHVNDLLYTIGRSHNNDSSQQPSTSKPPSAQLRSSCGHDSLSQPPLQCHLHQSPTPTNTPLNRQPSLQSYKLDYLYFTDLNRNSSVGTTMTSRTDDSYVTAQSRPSDDDN
ncbi:hypothetical protein BG000_003821 [Podila horticola]|nr:hypothetical protein BG000_003821 [Podila horticola]